MKTVFLRKLTYANLKRNLQEQIRYTLRNKDQEDLCEELVLMLTDSLSQELRDKVGPEDILSDTQLEELQDALNESARRILKTNRMQFNRMKRLEARVKRAIEKTLVAPQVTRLSEVRTALIFLCLLHHILEALVQGYLLYFFHLCFFMHFFFMGNSKELLLNKLCPEISNLDIVRISL